MSNFVNLVSDDLPGIDQYEDIFNTLAQSVKTIMDPTGDIARDNLNAATAVSGTLTTFGWHIDEINKDQIIADVTRRVIALLRRYLLNEDPSETTENSINRLIANLNNYLNNNNNNNNNDNGAAEAAGEHKRKSKKSRKSRKSRKSKKSRKFRK